MSQLITGNYEKFLVAVAAAVFATSCAWLWRQKPALRRLHSLQVAPQLVNAPYIPLELHSPEPVSAVWPQAHTQSHGRGWIYEVFTPPVIYYNALAQSFTVTPPLFQASEGTPFGVELLAVKPEQYRLQLAGYFGGPDDYVAAFTSAELPEMLLAHAGRRFDTLGLTLKSFAVKKVAVEHSDAWPVYDVAAFAVLQDDASGADVVLDSRSRKFTGTPLAVLKMLTGDGSPRELREGESFSDGTSTYLIERIQLDPPEVAVTRETPGLPAPETRILHPVAESDRLVANKPLRQFLGREATAIATSGK